MGTYVRVCEFIQEFYMLSVAKMIIFHVINKQTDLDSWSVYCYILLQESTEYLMSRHSICINFTALIIKTFGKLTPYFVNKL